MTNEQLHLIGGSWTDEKLLILSNYLKAYNIALKKQPFKRIYIDAFAGTGYRQAHWKIHDNFDLFSDPEEKDTQSFLDGSAKIALDVDPAFHRHIFVETNSAKIEELEKLKQDHPQKDIAIVQEDANSFVQNYCSSMTRSERAVVFLDPFATQTDWKTIEAIAQTKQVDVWILFPVMAVNRLLANDPDKVCKNALDRVFGTEDWFDAFYQKHTENDIFGQSLETIRKACNIAAIGDFYQKQLQKVFEKVAPRHRILKNSRQSPLFLFFFAASNPKGAGIAVTIANHILENI